MKSGGAGSGEVHPSWQESEGAANEDTAPPPPPPPTSLSVRCCQDLIFLSREGRDLEVAFQAPPGSQASSRAKK